MTTACSDALRSIGLRAKAESLTSLVALATAKQFAVTQFVEALVELERRERDECNLSTRLKMATLGVFKTIDQFDWNHPEKIDRSLYEELYQLDFVTSAHNVLFRGPSGIGKTMLAQNLAQRAILHGHSAKFCTLATAIFDLLKQESMPAVERRLRHYASVDLLVLDEVGYIPQDQRAGDMLYNIIARRHEKRATIITTNLPFKQWNTHFPGAACVGALVDRFAQHCHMMDIEGPSWRQRHAVARRSAAAGAKKKTAPANS